MLQARNELEKGSSNILLSLPCYVSFFHSLPLSVCTLCDNFDFYKYFDLFFSVAALLLLSLSLALPSPAWAAVTKHHSTCAMIDDAAQRSNLYCPAVAHTHNSLPTPSQPLTLPDPVSLPLFP